MHEHHHSKEHIKRVSNRLSRTLGHLNKVKDMVERDEDCAAILIQLAAVKAEVNSTAKMILKEHLTHCVIHAIEDNDMQKIKELERAIDMFVK